eukprot:11052667-Heterocapsa_arctica.AAC.1
MASASPHRRLSASSPKPHLAWRTLPAQAGASARQPLRKLTMRQSACPACPRESSSPHPTERRQ